MARYISSYTRRRFGNWIYLIVGLAVIAVVVLALLRSKRADIDKAGVGAPQEQAAQTDVQSPAEQSEPLERLIGEVPESVTEPDPKAAELIEEATALVAAKPPRIIETRDRLNELLAMPMSTEQRHSVKQQLSQLAGRWLFSRRIYPADGLCGSYTVKPGDLLSTIGKRFNVPYQIIAKINRIRRPESLQAGETIKVIKGPFHARVYRSSFVLDLYLQDTFVKSFPVGLGKEGMETPTGLWRVKSDGKLISPTWTDPTTGKTYKASDPDYPLGSRWIGLEGISGEARGRTGFAIHGTKDPNEIGTANSQGCIRLLNGDARLFYDILMPGLSKIEVVD